MARTTATTAPDIEPLVPTAVYTLGELICLPHYTLPNLFVIPGRDSLVTVEYLRQFGAEPKIMSLWKR